MNILKTLNPFVKDNSIQTLNINIVVLTILLYLFRSTIPFLKFPFLLLYLGLFIYGFLKYRSIIIPGFKTFFKTFLLSIVLLIILLAAFFLSEKYYLGVFKDIINAIILISLFFLMTLFLRSKSDLKIFYESLIKLVVLFSLLISGLLIGNFLNIYSWDIPNQVKSDVTKLSIEAISTDYNFVLLPVFFGFIGVFYLITRPISAGRKGILNFIMVIYFLTIFISGSRRGIITMICLVLIMAIVQVIALLKKNSRFEKIAINSRGFLLAIACMILIACLFVFKSSFYFKNDALRLIGSRDIDLTKTKVTEVALRYISVFNKNIAKDVIYDDIWYYGFDKSLDPNAGWGTSIHKTIYPLTGKNVEIVKPEAKGYLLDSTCNSQAGEGFAYSSTLIGNRIVNKGDTLTASMYCYVSEDFNGSLVQFYSLGSTYGETVKDDSLITSNANFSAVEDTLSNIHISNLVFNGNFKKGNSFWLPNADSTKHEIIDTPFGKGMRVSRTDGNGGYWSLYYEGPKIIYIAGHTYQLKFNMKVVKGTGMPFNIGWWANDGSKGYSAVALPYKLKDLTDGWKEVTCSYTFESTFYGLPSFLNSMQDHSVVDIANVELTDLNRKDSIPAFVNQLGLIDIDKNRGVWRRYTLKSACSNGFASVYLAFAKRNSEDFKSLKGYVIFAYPKYEIKKHNPAVPGGETSGLLNLYQPEVPRIVESERTSPELTSEAGLSPFYFSTLALLMQQVADHDPVRNFVAKLISEDTTYYRYKKALVVNPVSNKFIGDRVMRWEFASQIFLKEYGLKEKLFGGGFIFLNWYGFYFQSDQYQIDYPHNPLLSILLYSGLIGLFIYIFFFYRVIVLYLRYLKIYPVLAFFFLISAFFSFFSAGSPFDPPIMGFFMLLPFFINYLSNKKEEISK
jgi:hypothetical protein